MYLEYVVLLAGIALALGMDRAVLLWVPAMSSEAGSGAGLELRTLAWQRASMRPWVARAFGLGAVAAVLTAAVRFDDFEAVRVGVIGLALLACAATDLLAYRVPDAVTLPVLAFALVGSALGAHPPLVSGIAASMMAGGLLLGAAVLTRGGLGGGDVKLGALIGAALGLPLAAFALAAGIVIGGVVVIGLFLTGRLGRDQAFPFAPFLAIAGLAFLLAA